MYGYQWCQICLPFGYGDFAIKIFGRTLFEDSVYKEAWHHVQKDAFFITIKSRVLTRLIILEAHAGFFRLLM